MLISPQQIRQPEEEGVEQIKASVPLDLWGIGNDKLGTGKGVGCALKSSQKQDQPNAVVWLSISSEPKQTK
jgi:hypothetical protein